MHPLTNCSIVPVPALSLILVMGDNARHRQALSRQHFVDTEVFEIEAFADFEQALKRAQQRLEHAAHPAREARREMLQRVQIAERIEIGDPQRGVFRHVPGPFPPFARLW